MKTHNISTHFSAVRRASDLAFMKAQLTCVDHAAHHYRPTKREQALRAWEQAMDDWNRALDEAMKLIDPAVLRAHGLA
jgi:hypothetical protein